jgi:predicted nuclease of predicted toxin-antitoxin system
VKFKPAENLPASAAATLASAGHDVDTVPVEGLTGARDPDVVSAATGAGRILVSLDVGLASMPLRATPYRRENSRRDRP